MTPLIKQIYNGDNNVFYQGDPLYLILYARYIKLIHINRYPPEITLMHHLSELMFIMSAFGTTVQIIQQNHKSYYERVNM